MGRRALLSSLLLALALVLVSCASRVEFADGFWFQALGADGDIVILANLSSESSAIPAEFADLAGHADTVALAKRGDAVFGGIQGSFSSFAAKVATRKAGEALQLEFEVPCRGLALFGSSDCGGLETVRKETLEVREILISDEDAALMMQADVAVFARHPESVSDLVGFEVSDEVLACTERLLVLVHGETMDLRMRFDTESHASAFSVMLRSAYLAELRQAGLKPLASDLAGMFGIDGCEVTANGLRLPD